PNAHALAQTFVLFDNFYVDADVSYNGHSYSTAAYATDFIEKMWQTTMAGRGGPDLGEGGGFMRGPFGNISAPSRGYLWDYARRDGGRQRRRAGPDGRSRLHQRVLEGLGVLHPGRRCAERTGSCGFPSIGAARRKPVRQARVRRSHVLHDVGCAADDRAHPGARPDEPVRCGGDPAVQRVVGHPQPPRLQPAPAARGARRKEPGLDVRLSLVAR